MEFDLFLCLSAHALKAYGSQFMYQYNMYRYKKLLAAELHRLLNHNSFSTRPDCSHACFTTTCRSSKNYIVSGVLY